MGKNWKQNWNFLLWIVMHLVRKIYRSLRCLLKQEPEQCQVLLYTGHILENAYRFVQDQKEEEDSLELTLKKWMCAIENGTCSA